jgi:hypothetical protein
MNAYKVSFRTKWAGDDRLEKGWMNVVAENAEAAIEKTKKLNKEDTFKDDDGNLIEHDTFELLEVSLVTELDG